MVVNTYELAIELLENRSAQYSGRCVKYLHGGPGRSQSLRPPMTMVNELMGWDFNFTWMDYGATPRLLEITVT